MKKYLIVASLSVLAVSGVVAQVMREPSHEEVVQKEGSHTGQETVSSLRQDLQAGKYDSFLAGLDSDYQQLLKEGRLSEFIQMRDVPPADEKLDQLSAQWETIHQTLVDERNAELQVIGKEAQDPLLKKRIDSATSQLPKDQKEALQYLSTLRFKTPDQATSADEKTLIEIDLASEFKVLHLDVQYASKPFEDRTEKHTIVKMEMLKEMQEAAKTFTDQSLQKKVNLAAEGFDAWQARNFDLNELSRMAKKPSNENEKKIASVLSSYKAKKEKMYQEEFLAKLDA